MQTFPRGNRVSANQPVMVKRPENSWADYRGCHMSHESERKNTKLQVVHVCEACGAELSYSQVGEDVTVTGTVLCSKCGHLGPLRVEIREVTPVGPS